jgi:hypothetical protein
MMGLAPTAAVPKNLVIGKAQQEAFGDPAKERFRLPIPPSTIGNPHDAMYPLHRFVHWMAHEDGVGPQ